MMVRDAVDRADVATDADRVDRVVAGRALKCAPMDRMVSAAVVAAVEGVGQAAAVVDPEGVSNSKPAADRLQHPVDRRS